MAVTAVQKARETMGSVQCQRLKKQTRGYQVSYGLGSPDGRTKENYEVLPDQPRTTKHDPGIPLVRRDAAKHRLG